MLWVNGEPPFSDLTSLNFIFHVLKIDTVKRKHQVPSISSQNSCEIKRNVVICKLLGIIIKQIFTHNELF